MTATKGMSETLAITGADGHVGHALQRRLADRPIPIRPLGHGDAWPAAISDADAVIHLAGTLQPKRPNTYERANLGTVERFLAASEDSSLQRIVFLSYVGANPNSDNEYLRNKGQAEDLIRKTGIPSVVFRSTFIYGEPEDIGPSFASYQSRTGKAVSVLGDGTQKLAPIHADDLADMLIVAALDPETPTGTFDVGGPDVVTLDDFVRRINRPGVRIRHFSPTAARLLARVVPSLTPAMVELLLADSLPAQDPAETASRFGVTLRHLSNDGPPERDRG